MSLTDAVKDATAVRAERVIGLATGPSLAAIPQGVIVARGAARAIIEAQVARATGLGPGHIRVDIGPHVKPCNFKKPRYGGVFTVT